MRTSDRFTKEQELSYLKLLDERPRRWIRRAFWWRKVPHHCESLLSGLTSYLLSTRTVGPSPAVVNRFRQSLQTMMKHKAQVCCHSPWLFPARHALIPRGLVWKSLFLMLSRPADEIPSQYTQSEHLLFPLSKWKIKLNIIKLKLIYFVCKQYMMKCGCWPIWNDPNAIGPHSQTVDNTCAF